MRLKNYLDKVIEYEQVQANPTQTIEEKEWMKRVIHVIGGASASENEQFRGYMDGYKRIIEDSMMGASVSSFEKYLPLQ